MVFVAWNYRYLPGVRYFVFPIQATTLSSSALTKRLCTFVRGQPQQVGMGGALSDPLCKTVGAKVGTCGFGVSRAEYARTFLCVEIQHTFYQPPKLKTLERWRQQTPEDFEFTLKAWQLITHDSKSPTYRRLRRKLSEAEKKEVGYFRSSAIVKEAWEVTVESAKSLEATTILFQSPASFNQTQENIANLEKFFSSTDRKNLNFCWEPRGDWNRELLRSICKGLQLGHVVDPFVGKTVTPERCYFRLHGRGGWRYQYEVSELEELATAVQGRGSYVFFNNSRMTEDALRFCKLMS